MKNYLQIEGPEPCKLLKLFIVKESLSVCIYIFVKPGIKFLSFSRV